MKNEVFAMLTKFNITRKYKEIKYFFFWFKKKIRIFLILNTYIEPSCGLETNAFIYFLTRRNQLTEGQPNGPRNFKN